MRTWRLEAWTHPRKGATTYITDVPYHQLHLVDRSDAIVDSHVLIPAAHGDIIASINTANPADPAAGISTLLRVWAVDDDPTYTEPTLPDFEFFAQRIDWEISNDEIYAKITGPDIRAGADDARLLPFDYPGTASGNGFISRFPNWEWGGENLARNGDLESGGTTSEKQHVWMVPDADGVTALNGGIDASTTTVNVDTFAGFPGSVPYTIQIDDERLRVTAGHSTLTWTVTRGVDGTTAAAHADDAVVTEVPHGTFTLIFDGEETGNLDWSPPTGPAATAADIKTALETLPNIISVAVTGSGTPTDPWEVEFLDPDGDVGTLTGNDAVFGANLAAGLVVQTGGVASHEGWTHSYNPGTGLDHGTYAAEKITTQDLLGVGAITGDASLNVFGSSLYAGAQQIREVPPGALAQFSVNHRTIETGQTYRFVVRDLNEKQIADNAATEITPAADTITPITLTDVVIPNNVDKVIVRVGVVGPDGLTRSWFQLDDLVIRIGYPPASKGKIASDLLTDLQTSHAPRVRLSWLDWNFTPTLDSAGNPWLEEVAFRAAAGNRFGTGIMKTLSTTGADWDIEPRLDTGEPTAWELMFWEIGSRGTDLTSADDPIFHIGAGIAGGSIASSEPPYTGLLVGNDAGYFLELEDDDLVTAYGNIDGFIGSKDLRDIGIMEEVADHALAEAVANLAAVQCQLTSSDAGPIPWADFDKADLVNFALPGRLDTVHARRISQLTVDITPGGWTAEITASRYFTGIAAAEEGIRHLLERFDALEAPSFTGTGLATFQPADPKPSGGAAGAYLHVAHTTGQTIPDGGAAIEWDLLEKEPDGFPTVANDLPTDTIEIPITGYWNAAILAGWDTFVDGGIVTVTVERAGVETLVWPPANDPGLWTSTDGQLFDDEAKALPLEAGDLVRVYIDPNDGTSQDLTTATLTLYLVDRTSGGVSAGSLGGLVTTLAETGTGTTMTIDLPADTDYQPGDLLVVAYCEAAGNATALVGPAGWDLLTSGVNTDLGVWTKKASASEGTTVTVVGRDVERVAHAWVVRTGGWDWDNYPPDAGTAIVSGSSTVDPQPVEPSHGARRYFVLPVIYCNSDPTGWPDPAGYDRFGLGIQADMGGGLDAHLIVWDRLIAVGSGATEDPASLGAVASDDWQSVTLAFIAEA